MTPQDYEFVAKFIVRNAVEHGCFTGDCPHDKAKECEQAIAVDIQQAYEEAEGC